jgi:hypothetical protein
LDAATTAARYQATKTKLAAGLNVRYDLPKKRMLECRSELGDRLHKLELALEERDRNGISRNAVDDWVLELRDYTLNLRRRGEFPNSR